MGLLIFRARIYIRHMTQRATPSPISDDIDRIEAALRGAGVPVGHLLERSGVAPSTWHHWKVAKRSPNLETWMRAQRTAQQILDEVAASGAA